MQNKEAMAIRSQAFLAFADVTKGFASPRRLELLDLLVQQPRTVETVAEMTGMPTSTCSQHLQVLKRARLVEARREGTYIEYRAAPGVDALYATLLRTAEQRSPELASLMAQSASDVQETIEVDALAEQVLRGGVLIIDVRHEGEFVYAHLPGAINIPMRDLATRIAELPPAKLVVTTCRGRLCSYASLAVRMLRAQGIEAVRFDGGVAEWVATGRALEHGVP